MQEIVGGGRGGREERCSTGALMTVLATGRARERGRNERERWSTLAVADSLLYCHVTGSLESTSDKRK